ncbi:hypothetical protein N658DRAFT_497067 [Parathielavia hyrcaniae]|uniref:Uncharacterized protein n=1 Tax=Parathielavia hyrcaniae TaxID=113614 RepID=A0AAN6T1A8_9PEZI|nr:hypothetical protein N658DRAFT_497067 [Parathielavia hyrcaniae]
METGCPSLRPRRVHREPGERPGRGRRTQPRCHALPCCIASPSASTNGPSGHLRTEATAKSAANLVHPPSFLIAYRAIRQPAARHLGRSIHTVTRAVSMGAYYVRHPITMPRRRLAPPPAVACSTAARPPSTVTERICGVSTSEYEPRKQTLPACPHRGAAFHRQTFPSAR